MKNYLFAVLLLLPSMLLAQESRREATPEEIKHLLPIGGAEQMHKLREQMKRNEVLIDTAIKNGSLNQEEMKAHVQFLIDQNNSPIKMTKAINELGNQYMTKMMMKKLHAPLPEPQLKDFEKKVLELEQKEAQGKLSKAEIEFARAALDKKIAFAHVTEKDEMLRDNFKVSLNNLAQEMAKAKRVPTQEKISAMKVMVPTDFSLEAVCADPAVASDKKVNQLSSQVKTIVKPTVHKVWFVWPKDKVEMSAWYDEKNGLNLHQAQLQNQAD